MSIYLLPKVGMSDILIVEFYGEPDRAVAAVLAWHGGDNPASASLTLTEFLINLDNQIQNRQMGALELASRFIVSQVAFDPTFARGPELDAILIPTAASYGYQLCRLYVASGRVRAVVVVDEYSTTVEIEDAKAIWEMNNFRCDFLNSVEIMALVSHA